MPLWVSELAATFWELAGEEEPFPRDLHGPIANALPVSIVLLPRLRVALLDEWLRQRGMSSAVVPDRRLSACLVARAGQGFIFLDGGDPEDEQRFALAHELAHYLRDYWQPRQRILEQVGAAGLAVLDGERSPTPAERIDGILSRTPLGFYVHLMGRSRDGAIDDESIWRAERDADLLAFELLAPARAALEEPPSRSSDDDRGNLVRRLENVFGLPGSEAGRYAAILLPRSAPRDSLLDRLGLSS